jgi:GNAT superfamily N-acetyltransferase
MSQPQRGCAFSFRRSHAAFVATALPLFPFCHAYPKRAYETGSGYLDSNLSLRQFVCPHHSPVPDHQTPVVASGFKPIIRPASITDAPIVADFNARLADETEGIRLDPEILRAGVEAVLADPAKGLYWIAEAKGEVIGQLMITLEWSDWRNGYFWWIQSVYVRTDFRGRGVFKALYEFISTEAARRTDVCGLRLYVEQHNARARRTYERLGMRLTGYQLYEADFRLAR